MQSFFELGEDDKLKRMSPWLLRIELNREMMVRRHWPPAPAKGCGAVGCV